MMQYSAIFKTRPNLEERLLNDNYESLGESTDSFYSGFDILDSYQEVDEE